MKKLIGLFCLLLSLSFFSQVNPNDTIRVENHPTDSISIKEKTEIDVIADIEEDNAPAKKDTLRKLNPTKAGLYSAVLPGLGQFYNKKYWKIPIVWGAIGTGVGITLWNQKQYKRYRNAFVAELNGQPHEFSDYPYVTKETLGNSQDRAKRQRDYAIAITSLVYILNIVDAVVDSHLYEGRRDPDLAIQPTIITPEHQFQKNTPGISMTFNF